MARAAAHSSVKVRVPAHQRDVEGAGRASNGMHQASRVKETAGSDRTRKEPGQTHRKHHVETNDARNLLRNGTRNEAPVTEGDVQILLKTCCTSEAKRSGAGTRICAVPRGKGTLIQKLTRVSNSSTTRMRAADSSKFVVEISAAAAVETSESLTEENVEEVPQDQAAAAMATDAMPEGEKPADEKPAGGKAGRKTRGGRRPRKTITVKMEELVTDQMLKGKVCNLTTYGAFVDVGAKSDGLIHISELSTGFVSEVGEVVSVGQEVDVRVLSVDLEKNRIALSLVSKEAKEQVAEARTEGADMATGEKPAPGKVARRQKKDKRQQRPKINLKRGQKVKGPVSSITSFGCFVTVAEGVEGLVHISEMTDESDKEASDLVNVGDEVEVRVLSVQGGKISLTMKEQLDASAFTSSSPEIGSAETALEFALKRAGLSRDLFPDAPSDSSEQSEEVTEAPAPAAVTEAPAAPAEATPKTSTGSNVSAKDVKALRDQTGAGMMDCKKALAENDGDIEAAAEFLRKKGMASADKKAGRVAAEGAVASYIHPGSRIGVLVEVNSETDFVARGEIFQQLVQDIAMQIAANPDVEFVSTADADPAWVAKEKEIEMGKEDILSKPENIREKMVEGRLAKTIKEKALLEQDFIKDTDKTVQEYLKETVASCGENLQIRRFVRYNLGEGIEKKDVNFAEEVAQQTQVKEDAPVEAKSEAAPEPAKAEEAPTVAVSAKDVKALRDQTGAGMMDCKKALAENDGDIEAAAEFLRKKGMASADKKAGRVAAEGAVASYIHPGSRIGVLVEVNSETDFVARGEIFQQLVQDIAMQIAANPDVEFVSTADADPAWVAKEKEIEMGKEDILSKPENIREKMVEGRLAKTIKEKALLEQDFIKDTDKTVQEYLKETVASCGENLQIRRFVRYNLGEGIEKKDVNFAEEVAQQTGRV